MTPRILGSCRVRVAANAAIFLSAAVGKSLLLVNMVPRQMDERRQTTRRYMRT